MKLQLAGGLAALCFLGIMLTGCAATTTPTSPKRVVIAGQAKLDLASDTATFPLDHYQGEGSGVDFSNAGNLAIQDCMIAAGHDWKTPIFTGSGSNNWRLFGLWNAPLAAQYGYDAPKDPESSPQNLNGTNLSSEVKASFKGCQSKSDKLFPFPDPWAGNSTQNLGHEAYFQTMKDAEAKKLIAVWEKCMITRGVTVDVNKSGVLMADVDMKTMPLEQQLQTAVNEVQCKTDNNIVQQLADIDASYQVVLIAKHQVELNKELALNKKTDAAVAKYLATHG